MHCNDWHVRLSKQTALEVFLRNDIMAVIRGVLQKRIFYGQADRKGSPPPSLPLRSLFVNLFWWLQKIAIYCPQGSGTLRQQLLMMH